jgi:hypothetical protein
MMLGASVIMLILLLVVSGIVYSETRNDSDAKAVSGIIVTLSAISLLAIAIALGIGGVHEVLVR